MYRLEIPYPFDLELLSVYSWGYCIWPSGLFELVCGFGKLSKSWKLSRETYCQNGIVGEDHPTAEKATPA